MALPRLFKKPKHAIPETVEHDLRAWFDTELGQQLVEREGLVLDQVLPSMFGYHQMQAGIGIAPNSLDASPIRHKFFIEQATVSDPVSFPDKSASQPASPVPLRADLKNLPIQSDSVDCAILHHSLEYETNINQVLRETARVLMPGGSLVIVGFNPWSIWGLWRRVIFKIGVGPWAARFVSPYKISEWLELLDFEVEGSESAFYLPPVKSERATQWFRWLEPLCSRWLPHSGAFYVFVAKKRVSLVTPLRPKRRPLVRKLVHALLPRAQTSPNTPLRNTVDKDYSTPGIATKHFHPA